MSNRGDPQQRAGGGGSIIIITARAYVYRRFPLHLPPPYQS